jgi:ABC-2 type transport system permease protein
VIARAVWPRGMSRLLLIVPMSLISYRADAIVRILMIVSRVFLFFFLWSAVYRPGQVTGGLDLRQAITYSTLAALLAADRGYPTETFSDRIRDGTVVYLFLRPLSPVRYFWGVQLGGIAFRLVLILSGAAIGIAAGVVSLPSSPALLLVVLIGLFLADLLFSVLMLLLELVAFWTTDIRGVRDLFLFAVALLTGALVPIWFFPDWAVSLLAWTPFPSAASTPISLYIGRIPAADAGVALLIQAGWLVALTAFTALLWRRVEDRVVVQGG